MIITNDNEYRKAERMMKRRSVSPSSGNPQCPLGMTNSRLNEIRRAMEQYLDLQSGRKVNVIAAGQLARNIRALCYRCGYKVQKPIVVCKKCHRNTMLMIPDEMKPWTILGTDGIHSTIEPRAFECTACASLYGTRTMFLCECKISSVRGQHSGRNFAVCRFCCTKRKLVDYLITKKQQSAKTPLAQSQEDAQADQPVHTIEQWATTYEQLTMPQQVRRPLRPGGPLATVTTRWVPTDPTAPTRPWINRTRPVPRDIDNGFGAATREQLAMEEQLTRALLARPVYRWGIDNNGAATVTPDEPEYNDNHD